MKINIKCAGVIDLTEEEIKKSVPDFILKEIKSTNNKTLHAFIGLHEGHFKPFFFDGDPKVLTLTSNGLQSAYQKIKIGTPLIKGHRSNLEEPVKSIGAIVGKIVKGQNIIIVCHGNGLEDFNATSVEMRATTINQKINSVDEVFCFAMLDETQEPSIYNAYKIAELAASAEVKITDHENKEIKEGYKMPTLKEIKEVIKENGYIPSQFFSVDDVRSDKTYTEIFTPQEKMTKEIEKLKDSLQEKENIIKNRDNIDKLNELLTSGYTESQIKYIKHMAKKESFDKPEDFIKNKIEDLKELGITVAKETLDENKDAQNQPDNNPVPSSWNSKNGTILDSATNEGLQALQRIINN